jgi:hypothetical protein
MDRSSIHSTVTAFHSVGRKDKAARVSPDGHSFPDIFSALADNLFRFEEEGDLDRGSDGSVIFYGSPKSDVRFARLHP